MHEEVQLRNVLSKTFEDFDLQQTSEIVAPVLALLFDGTYGQNRNTENTSNDSQSFVVSAGLDNQDIQSGNNGEIIHNSFYNHFLFVL